MLLTALRVVVMDHIFSPLAQLRGLKGKGKVRFAEQAWLIIYAGTSSAVGTVGRLVNDRSETDISSISCTIQSTGSIYLWFGRTGRIGK